MVTHLLGWAPLVVMAVMSESSSSFFSFSFFTRLSMARLEKASLSPPCLWHIRLCTMLRHASLLVGVLVIDILISLCTFRRQITDKVSFCWKADAGEILMFKSSNSLAATTFLYLKKNKIRSEKFVEELFSQLTQVSVEWSWHQL